MARSPPPSGHVAGALVLLCSAAASLVEQCPGAINVPGVEQPVQITVTMVNTDDADNNAVEVAGDKVMPHLGGRSYWSSLCNAGVYDPNTYLSLPLLDRRIRYTTDVSQAGCGCNAAFYLTPMFLNSELGTCGDYYCDAQAVCGVTCAEIDIQENNRFAWASTFHAEDDHWGKAVGYGGGGDDWNGPRDFGKAQYGPAGDCVDTDFPFQVVASFPVGSDGILAAMTIELSQAGMPCTITASIDQYDGNASKWREGSRHGMKQMTEALSMGMTPIISFWESKDMLWMDGKGEDNEGPCKRDLLSPCSESVSFYDFVVEDLHPTSTSEPIASSTSSLAEATAAPTPAPTPGPAPNRQPLIIAVSVTVLVVAGGSLGAWLCLQRRCPERPLLGAE